LNDDCARTGDGARTNCDTWSNVGFRCHPSIFTNNHWPSHKWESWLQMIVGCGTKKGSLTNDHVTAEYDPVDAVAVNASSETAARFHNQIPWRPDPG
jgi:hypothetical protein